METVLSLLLVKLQYFDLILLKLNSTKCVFSGNFPAFLMQLFCRKPMNSHFQKQPPEMFFKKAVLKNFAIFIGKQYSQEWPY